MTNDKPREWTVMCDRVQTGENCFEVVQIADGPAIERHTRIRVREVIEVPASVDREKEIENRARNEASDYANQGKLFSWHFQDAVNIGKRMAKWADANPAPRAEAIAQEHLWDKAELRLCHQRIQELEKQLATAENDSEQDWLRAEKAERELRELRSQIVSPAVEKMRRACEHLLSVLEVPGTSNDFYDRKDRVGDAVLDGREALAAYEREKGGV